MRSSCVANFETSVSELRKAQKCPPRHALCHAIPCKGNLHNAYLFHGTWVPKMCHAKRMLHRISALELRELAKHTQFSRAVLCLAIKPFSCNYLSSSLKILFTCMHSGKHPSKHQFKHSRHLPTSQMQRAHLNKSWPPLTQQN